MSRGLVGAPLFSVAMSISQQMNAEVLWQSHQQSPATPSLAGLSTSQCAVYYPLHQLLRAKPPVLLFGEEAALCATTHLSTHTKGLQRLLKELSGQNGFLSYSVGLYLLMGFYSFLGSQDGKVTL